MYCERIVILLFCWHGRYLVRISSFPSKFKKQPLQVIIIIIIVIIIIIAMMYQYYYTAQATSGKILKTTVTIRCYKKHNKLSQL